MRRRTCLVAVGLLTALALPPLFVPRVSGRDGANIPWATLRYEWVWTPTAPRLTAFGAERPWPVPQRHPYPTLWWLVALEELLVIVSGGGLLARSVRRDRP